MEINAYGTIMFLMGSVVGAVVKTFIEFSIRQHFERKEKCKRKEKKARRIHAFTGSGHSYWYEA